MMINNRYLSVLAMLVLSAIACNLPFWGSSDSADEPVVVSTEAVQSLKDDVRESQESLETSDEMALTFTESQLTSLVAFELADQPDAPIRDVEIRLREGQIQVSGQFQQGNASLPLSAVFRIMAVDGGLDYEIVSAKIGIIPLPEDVIVEFTSQFDEIFAARFESETSGLYIESVTIQEGEMVVRGRNR